MSNYVIWAKIDGAVPKNTLPHNLYGLRVYLGYYLNMMNFCFAPVQDDTSLHWLVVNEKYQSFNILKNHCLCLTTFVLRFTLTFLDLGTAADKSPKMKKKTPQNSDYLMKVHIGYT